MQKRIGREGGHPPGGLFYRAMCSDLGENGLSVAEKDPVLAVCTFLLSSEGVFQGFHQFGGALGSVFGSETLKTLIKAVVDTVLFIVNYQLCRRWVFPEKKRGKDA